MEGFQALFQFFKIFLWSPFGSASDACGPPFGFESKFQNHSKPILMAPN